MEVLININFDSIIKVIIEGVASGLVIAAIIGIIEFYLEKERNKTKAFIATLEWYFPGVGINEEHLLRNKMYFIRKKADDELKKLINNHKMAFDKKGGPETTDPKKAIAAYIKKKLE